MRQPLLIPILYKGDECYQLVESWAFTTLGIRVSIPKGFVADGASVPRALWPFMPPDGTHRAASLAHDWLYVNKGHVDDTEFVWTRSDADETFLELMIKALISPARARIAYRGVRLGGWWVWSRPKKPPVILPIRNALAASVQKRRLIKHLYAP